MIYNIYPKQDTTIYEKKSDLNAGIDPLLEISKIIDSSASNTVYSSRVLMKFNYDDFNILSGSGFDKTSANNKYVLKLYVTEIQQTPTDFTLEVDTVSGSWNMGLGKYDYDPYITDGVSWKYKTSKLNGTIWRTSSFAIGSTGSWTTTPGGGTWYDNSILITSKSYGYNEINDVEIDVSTIIYSHITSVVPNNGLLIRRSTADESSVNDEMKLKFFSSDTNTIYLPHLRAYWNDWSWNTGSLNPLTQDENVVVFKNLRSTYYTDERTKFRIAGRPKFPAKTFVTKSIYSYEYYLPASSSYSVEDLHTKEVVIPHDDIYTRISCDATSSYFSLYMNGLQPERWYKFVIKSKFNESDIRKYDGGYIFKVERPA